MSYLHKNVFIFMLIALMGAQVSCGFHLRGNVALPDFITPVLLELNGNDDDLRRELEKSLTASGEQDIASSLWDAKTVLSISSVRKKRRVISVDSRGRAREYELNYQFNYILKKVSESNQPVNIIKTNTIKLQRDVLFDPDNVLASGHDENVMYADMRKDAAQLLLRQLSAIKPTRLQAE